MRRAIILLVICIVLWGYACIKNFFIYIPSRKWRTILKINDMFCVLKTILSNYMMRVIFKSFEQYHMAFDVVMLT